VVATDQALHFRQLFLTLEKMGLEWSSRCQHVNFGRVHGMSTRKGTMRTLADVLDEAHRVALQKVTENVAAGRIQTDDPEVLAEQIGIGAIVFGDLKNKRTADYDFDLEAFTSFEGHTGAYLQYAYARTRNVLRKGGGAPATFDPALLTLPEEQALVRALAQLPVVMRQALAELEPSLVSRHMLEVASEFSRYFTAGNQDRDKRVLVEGEDKAAVRAARLALTDATRATLAAGLQLLGIPTPESM
jgi:arginyl-tRNA synthetase